MQPIQLDLDSLKHLDDLVKDPNGLFYFKQGDIPDNESVYVRLLMPRVYSGRWFVQASDHWMKVGEKKVKVVSPELVGEQDLIKAWVHDIRTNPNVSSGQKALIKNDQVYDHQNHNFLFSCLILDNVKMMDGVVKDFQVRKDKVANFSCSISLLKQINVLVLDEQFATSSGKGIADPTNGYTFKITKSVVNKKTTYTVQLVVKSHPIDVSWEEKADDILLSQKRQMYSDAYMKDIFLQMFGAAATMADVEWRFPDVRDQDTSAIAVDTPKVDIPAAPKVEIPPVQAPTVNVPTVEAPTVEVPTVPSVELPNIPNVTVAPELDIPASLSNPGGMAGGAKSLLDAVQESMKG